jgi:hypothetical protein
MIAAEVNTRKLVRASPERVSELAKILLDAGLAEEVIIPIWNDRQSDHLVIQESHPVTPEHWVTRYVPEHRAPMIVSVSHGVDITHTRQNLDLPSSVLYPVATEVSVELGK